MSTENTKFDNLADFFTEAFSNDPEVPEDIKRLSTRLCRSYGIRGLCDPMYIANVIAVELGRGDGIGNFFKAGAVCKCEESDLQPCGQENCTSNPKAKKFLNSETMWKGKEPKQETDLEFQFNGVIAEIQTWFNKGTDAQKELLIESLRNCSDLIDSDMPTIEEGDL